MDSKKKRQNFVLILIISDLVFVNLSFLLAYWIRFSFPAPKGIPSIEPYLNALVFVSIVFLLVLRNLGFYRPRRGHSVIDEFYSTMIASSLAIMVLVALTFFYREFEYSRLVLILAWGISMVLLGGSRVSLSKLEEVMRAKGIGVITVLIVGAGTVAKMIEERIKNHPGLGYDIIGFLDDYSEGERVLGKVSDLGKVCRERDVEMAIIALSSPKRELISEVVNTCLREKVPFRVVPDLFDVITSPRIEEIDGIPVIALREGPLRGWNKFLKRAIDAAISLIGLIITFPLFVVIAILIKLTSRGPVFFSQERVGQGGKIFIIHKFRSMKVDAEAETGPVWTKGDDTRKTRVGYLLRRFSLDELPQLWCVLRGDMSLIGPRPERPVFVEKFRENVPRYMARHNVKPGITGWAQVNGFRGNTAVEKRTVFDLYYIDNWSLFFDLKMFIKTIFEFVFHKHAY